MEKKEVYFFEEIGFRINPGEHIEIWLEGGRSLRGKLVRYDPKYQNMVLKIDDGKEAFIPRRFVVAIIKA